MPEPGLFAYCPRCAAPAAGDDGRAFRCTACGFRYFHNVASAVAAFVVHAGELLVTRRAHAPAAGTLDVPGGFVEPGETALDALARELGEELGWRALPASPAFLCALPNRYDYGGVSYATCDLFFRIRARRRPPVAIGAEIGAAHWLALDTLDRGAFGFASVRAALGYL